MRTKGEGKRKNLKFKEKIVKSKREKRFKEGKGRANSGKQQTVAKEDTNE